MGTAQELEKKTRGQQLTNVERQVLISKMMDYMTEGLISTHALAKKLRVSRRTVDAYKPIVDDFIARQKIDRNTIRNLQIRRTYNIIEMLMSDLKHQKEARDRSAIYNQIYKFSSHLALITGLNIETHVNIDPSKLVIIRSKNKKIPNETDAVPATAAEPLTPELTDGGLEVTS